MIHSVCAFVGVVGIGRVDVSCLYPKARRLTLGLFLSKGLGGIFFLCVRRGVVSLLLVSSVSWAILLEPAFVGIANAAEDYLEREPGDQDRVGSSGGWSGRAQDAEQEPSDTDGGGHFGDEDFSGEEIAPGDLDREGDFGRSADQPDDPFYDTIQPPRSSRTAP